MSVTTLTAAPTFVNDGYRIRELAAPAARRSAITGTLTLIAIIAGAIIGAVVLAAFAWIIALPLLAVGLIWLAVTKRSARA
jgi:hypothetical protein